MYCRESNTVRLSSQKSRAIRNVRAARAGYRANPNKGTAERRRDRILAFVSLRAKLRYVSACCQDADFSTAHALGQAYQEAYKSWKGEYDSAIAL